jgi:hypothetical protein
MGLTVKLSFWAMLPWHLAGLGHPDGHKAREVGRYHSLWGLQHHLQASNTRYLNHLCLTYCEDRDVCCSLVWLFHHSQLELKGVGLQEQ